MKPIIRYTGSPDSLPEQWLRIDHLTEQPGPGSAYRVTIEKVENLTPPSMRWVLSQFLEAWEQADEDAMSIAAGHARKALGTEDAK